MPKHATKQAKQSMQMALDLRQANGALKHTYAQPKLQYSST